MRKKQFPISGLDYYIDQKLKEIIGDSVPNLRRKKNLIDRFVIWDEDEGRALWKGAEVDWNLDEDNNKYPFVKISRSFCQLIWFVSYMALLSSDYILTSNGAQMVMPESENSDLKDLLNRLDVDKLSPQQKDIIEYLKITSDKDEVIRKLDEVTLLVKRLLLDPVSEEDFSRYHELFNSDSSLTRRVNGIYSYAVVFIILHELAHIEYDDLDKCVVKDDEENADLMAYIYMYAVDESEIFSANVGILVAFASTMLLNPLFIDDNRHPLEYHRLLDYFDKIMNEMDQEHQLKLKRMLCNLIAVWAVTYRIEGAPAMDHHDKRDELTGRIRKFLDNWTHSRFCRELDDVNAWLRGEGVLPDNALF